MAAGFEGPQLLLLCFQACTFSCLQQGRAIAAGDTQCKGLHLLEKWAPTLAMRRLDLLFSTSGLDRNMTTWPIWLFFICPLRCSSVRSIGSACSIFSTSVLICKGPLNNKP